MRYAAPPYTYDVLPDPPAKERWLASALWRAVEERFRDACRRFGYREIRTPVLEMTELFTRSVGETSDIVSKEMFTLTDRGGRSLTLKPEGTAGAARACIEHGLLQGLTRLYYIGQNFRAERGQRGRYRQHQQFGVEAFGSADPALDAEVILLALEFFREVGITGLELRINSIGMPEHRGAYREALRDFVRPKLDGMSEEARARFDANPLRMLDTKHPADLAALEGAPGFANFLDPESADHFAALQRYLAAAGAPFEVDARLVRGFDYYTRTVFEITSPHVGAQSALGGGGRYDNLVEDCGGPPTPGIGFGLGMERCLIALQELGAEPSVPSEAPDVFLITLGSDDAVREAAVRLVLALRRAGIAADMGYGSRKFPAQAKRADELGAAWTLILGDEELARGAVQLRSQATKEQSEIPLADAVERVRAAVAATQ